MKREEILETARTVVTKDQASLYGKPENNFARIALIWEAVKGIKFTPEEVAAMLAGVKLARIATSPQHADNWVDLAGYAACGGEIAVTEKTEIP